MSATLGVSKLNGTLMVRHPDAVWRRLDPGDAVDVPSVDGDWPWYLYRAKNGPNPHLLVYEQTNRRGRKKFEANWRLVFHVIICRDGQCRIGPSHNPYEDEEERQLCLRRFRKRRKNRSRYHRTKQQRQHCFC